MSPTEYGAGMNDEQLKAAHWAAGLDVWGPVKRAYGDFVGNDTQVNSQLWSLAQAIRKAERERVAAYLDRAVERKRQTAAQGLLADTIVADSWAEVADWCRDETIWNGE